ncbi:hypothetical protein VYU27_005666 [Nannochloropsis oceanica]
MSPRPRPLSQSHPSPSPWKHSPQDLRVHQGATTLKHRISVGRAYPYKAGFSSISFTLPFPSLLREPCLFNK